MENLQPWSGRKTADGFEQSQVAFLNQIQEGHAAAGVMLGNADNQPQVGPHHAIARLGIAARNAMRQLLFFVGGQQLVLADFRKIQLNFCVFGGRMSFPLPKASRRSHSRGNHVTIAESEKWRNTAA